MNNVSILVEILDKYLLCIYHVWKRKNNWESLKCMNFQKTTRHEQKWIHEHVKLKLKLMPWDSNNCSMSLEEIICLDSDLTRRETLYNISELPT